MEGASPRPNENVDQRKPKSPPPRGAKKSPTHSRHRNRAIYNLTRDVGPDLTLMHAVLCNTSLSAPDLGLLCASHGCAKTSRALSRAAGSTVSRAWTKLLASLETSAHSSASKEYLIGRAPRRLPFFNAHACACATASSVVGRSVAGGRRSSLVFGRRSLAAVSRQRWSTAVVVHLVWVVGLWPSVSANFDLALTLRGRPIKD